MSEIEPDGPARSADGEGGGGAHGDESFTMVGPRGKDAERGEYYKGPDEEEDDDSDA